MKSMKGAVLSAFLCASLVCAIPASAKQTLDIYSSLPEKEVKVYVDAFEQSHPNIDVSWIRLSTGQMYARIKAEQNNPQASLWFGGPTATYIRAADEGLFAQYKGKGWRKTDTKYKG